MCRVRGSAPDTPSGGLAVPRKPPAISRFGRWRDLVAPFATHPEQDLRGEVDTFLAEVRAACPELAPRLRVDCDEAPCLLAVDLLDGEPIRLPRGCDRVGEHALRRPDAFGPRPERGQRLVFVVPPPSAEEEPDRRQRMRNRRLQERP